MTLDEMEDVLSRLGVQTVGTRGSEIQGFCPGHVQRTGHEDRNPSWYINADTGAHICFSCQFKGSLFYLICYAQNFYTDLGADFEAAKKWLNDGGELSEALERATAKKTELFEELIHISEAALAAFSTPPDFALKSRGLKESSAAHYEILWDTRRENWITPIRNAATGALMGWQEKGYRGRFFRNYPSGMKKSESLFGFKQYIEGDMIVVESPLDVVRLHSLGITGGVATFGSMVSKDQINLIRSADRVIFAMDNDEAGAHSSINLLHASRVFGFDAWFFDYTGTDMKDVGGMSRSEVEQGLANAKHSINWSAWE